MSDWYKRNYPQGPDYDPRLFKVLESWQRLYNIHRTGKRRLDGGFRPCGNGLEVRLPFGSLSTFDDSGLTNLVVAAHRYQCRVEIRSAGRGLLVIRVHPRDPEATSLYERHPSLDDLARTLAESKSA